jgi:hypothetical protein
MPPLPARMQKNAVDERGYPIPWNVLIDANGRAVFTANDSRKHMTALANDLCPLCGEKNDSVKWFVGGPMSAFHPNGWYFDLPGHQDCIEFALRVCPYLAAPNYAKRIDLPKGVVMPKNVIGTIDHTQDPRRPVVFVAVACNQIEMNKRPKDANDLPYVRPHGERVAVTFWRHGKRLDHDEVKALPDLFGDEKYK